MTYLWMTLNKSSKKNMCHSWPSCKFWNNQFLLNFCIMILHFDIYTRIYFYCCWLTKYFNKAYILLLGKTIYWVGGRAGKHFMYITGIGINLYGSKTAQYLLFTWTKYKLLEYGNLVTSSLNKGSFRDSMHTSQIKCVRSTHTFIIQDCYSVTYGYF